MLGSDVGDGTIQHRHRKAGQDHEHRPPPLGCGRPSRACGRFMCPVLPLPSSSLRGRALSFAGTGCGLQDMPFEFPQGWERRMLFR
jgi:hypothetical protein